jgi:hypothetical protein
LQKVSDVHNPISAFNTQITRFIAEIETLLQAAGVPAADRAAFRPAFPADTEPALVRPATQLQQAIRALEGQGENPAKGTVRWIEQQINALLAKDTADKARQERIKVIQTRVSAIATELERLEAEIAQIEGPERERLNRARADRLDAYVANFDNLTPPGTSSFNAAGQMWHRGGLLLTRC